MLSWDDFRYVKAIADTRSLGGAAAELSVNHSTVFRRLAQIEEQLGSRLFERSRGGYALTPCGEEMVRLAERMGEDIVAFERQVTGPRPAPLGRVARHHQRHRADLPDDAGVRGLPQGVSGDLARCRGGEPGAQSFEARRGRRDPRHRAPARNADRPAHRRHRMGGVRRDREGAADLRSANGRARCRVDRLRRQPREPEGREVAEGARPDASSTASTRCWVSRRRPRPASASASSPASSAARRRGSPASPRPSPTWPRACGCSPIRTCGRPRACAPSWISPGAEIAKQRKQLEGAG